MVFIYALIDPRNNEVRYIGQTKNRTIRYKQHKQDQDENAAKHEWIAEIKSLGLEPGYTILEEVDWDQRLKREKHWIQHHQSLGATLTNQIVTGRARRDIQADKAKEQRERFLKMLEEM